MRFYQFRLNVNIDKETTQSVQEIREELANLLRKAANQVLVGGAPEDCGASHLHEADSFIQNGDGDWLLQVDD